MLQSTNIAEIVYATLYNYTYTYNLVYIAIIKQV